MSHGEVTITMGRQFDFSAVPFTPARNCERIGLIRFTGAVSRTQKRSSGNTETAPAAIETIEMIPPGDAQTAMAAEACKPEKIWKNLGFRRPLPEHLFHRRCMPGGGGFEPVEILLVKKAASMETNAGPFGLFILYDFPNPRPNAVEIDFAVIDPEQEGRFSLFGLKTLIDCYLCGIRGAKHVCWKRTKRAGRYWLKWTDLKKKLERFEKDGTPVPQARLRA